MSRNAITVAADLPTVHAESPADWRRPFRRLDALLADAVAQARLRYGADAGHDSFRGLYITDEAAADALRHPPGEPLRTTPRTPGPAWAEVAAHHPGWAWLRGTAGLTDTELDVVLIALAPEADLRYERLYGYLQDDVSRRRPTAGLVLDLISTSADEKLRHRALFAPDGRLVGGRLLELVAEDRVPAPPLPARVVVLDEQVTGALLLPGGLDRQLAAHCRLTRPAPGAWAETPLPPRVRERVLDAARNRRPTRIHLHGPPGSGRRAAAEALAGELGLPMLALRTAHLPDADEEAATVVARAFREAVLHGALLFVDGTDALPSGSRRRIALAESLAEHPGITLLSGAQPWTAPGDRPLAVLEVTFGRPGQAIRRAAWQRHLDRAGTGLPAELARTLADRFTFGPARIAEAVTSAVTAADAGRPTAAQVFAAARRQTGHRLAALARRIEPVTTWSDLVLPPGTVTHLSDLCARVRLRSTVLYDWGFDRKLPRGRGTSALFTGPPGTGKTSAAEVIAAELGLDLYSIDLSAVVSKYIGETEKNLERIFSAAGDADAILMFDEADALFGKRSEVHDAHDRYANVETAYLLQRMEQYEGIAILATNLRQNLDEAFTRRLQFVVDFPFPDEAQRAEIWRISFPAGAPLAGEVDVAALGRDYRLTGAEIRNAALHAAYLAAARGAPIGTDVLHQAARREFQKMGRVPPEPSQDRG
ncbi:AAA family ATPase [Nonomuraea rubra]|uniref:AAA family ATPase n=1 Tax=Nonomuraea rubra TaxID=46180 RepID=UPI003411C0E0